MKTIHGIAVTLILCVLSDSPQAQDRINHFKMKQVVEVELPTGKQQQQLSILMKNDKVRMVSSTPVGTNTTFYFDSIKTTFVLTDMAGTKSKKTITEDQKAEAEKRDGIEVMNVAFKKDEKVILGYTCKKAIIELKRGIGIEYRTVWYAPALKNPIAYDFGISGMGKMNGLVLEYENKVMGLSMTHRVTELDVISPISDDEFAIPRGF
jgi:hypothetical protein